MKEDPVIAAANAHESAKTLIQSQLDKEMSQSVEVDILSQLEIYKHSRFRLQLKPNDISE